MEATRDSEAMPLRFSLCLSVGPLPVVFTTKVLLSSRVPPQTAPESMTLAKVKGIHSQAPCSLVIA